MIKHTKQKVFSDREIKSLRIPVEVILEGLGFYQWEYEKIEHECEDGSKIIFHQYREVTYTDE